MISTKKIKNKSANNITTYNAIFKIIFNNLNRKMSCVIGNFGTKTGGLVADWTCCALIHFNNMSKKIETIFEELKQKIDIKRNISDIPSQTKKWSRKRAVSASYDSH
jgi:hypothetical protein